MKFLDTLKSKFKKTGADASAVAQFSIEEEGIKQFQEFVAPPAVKIESNYIQIGRKFARTIFIFTYPRFLRTAWLSPIINLNRMHDIAIFIRPVDSATVLRNLTSRLAKVQAEIEMRAEKGFVRDPKLETAREDIESLRIALQQGHERFFKAGIYFTIYGDSPQEVTDLEKEIIAFLENRLIYAKICTFQQEEGFTTTLPIVFDKINVTTSMNTSPLSTTFPFISSDVSSNKGILYGINRHNNSLILFDRFSLENANTIIIGKSGGGKSYAAKLEIMRYLMLGVDVIIIDPENEYQYLCETVGGTYFKISLTSPHHLNPFDLPPIKPDEDPANILKENIIDLVAIMRIMLGGFTPEEDSLMDKAITETYASRDIKPGVNFEGKTPPTLVDLKNVLEDLAGGKDLATKLEKYITGRFAGFFNNQSNVDINKGLVVFNIRDMEEDLRPVAMYIIVNYIWKKIRATLRKRLLFIDEAWWMLSHEDSAAFLFALAKRCRKYYLGLTTITQDINDFLKSRYGEPIITNSSLQILFKQSPATVDLTQRVFNLTDEEKYVLLQSKIGEGIFFAGLKRAAIQVVASYSEDQIITSDPEQILKIEKAKKQLLEEGILQTPGAQNKTNDGAAL
jgi:type IV secretory pathway VirB4 component